MRYFAAISLLMLSLVFLNAADKPADLAGWAPFPSKWQSAKVVADSATLTADTWSYLRRPSEFADVEISANLFIREPGKRKSFFGESWSVWPDKTFGDQGWDAALLLRSSDSSGYRVQVSASFGEVALVKFPSGGYVRSVHYRIPVDSAFKIAVQARANRVTVLVDGKELFSFVDAETLSAGKVGIGVNSGAKVDFENVAVTALAPSEKVSIPAHRPNFSERKWVGGRRWVFDGAEPIMLLPDPASSTINNVKLRPGYRPLLSFNSHWDIQNQGAYPEGQNDTSNVKVTGGGKELVASWVGNHKTQRFATKTRMTFGWDEQRSTYTYDVESELEVNSGEPFLFRYGFDFEHHTPLDPFNWQYLVFRKNDGTLNRRPVCPVDPGPQYDLETSRGLRVWHGRHADPVPVSPAVEYRIHEVGNRKLNSAVCAAFYDTGVSFPAETLKAGEKIRVDYRYTGYPADEAAKLFKEAKIYDCPTLDSKRNYIFAEWPKVTFSKFAPLSESWVYGQVPFMTGSNARPAYELIKVPDVGTGYAMKLGPMAFGAAALPVPVPLVAGRYVLTVRAKGDNLYGPGGRIELMAADSAGKPILAVKHFIGSDTFGWKTCGFAFDLPIGLKTLTLGFGNGGTGDVYFTDAEFRLVKSDDPLPDGISASANPLPAKVASSPTGAIADFRMIEGRGMHAFDFAGGPYGVLELANLKWVTDSGRPAIRFADNLDNKSEYPDGGTLDLNYHRLEGYKGRQSVPVALAGHHGGGFDVKGFTLVAWIKPATTMGSADRDGTGDVIGIGGRRVVLRLLGKHPPYQLQAAIDVNDSFTATDAKLDADRWYQVAVSGEAAADKKWKVRMYLDGKAVHEASTKKDATRVMPASIVMGTELFYFHDSYYRGLLGRTLVFDRSLESSELEKLKPNETK